MVTMADVPLRPPLAVTTYTAAIRTDADLLASAATEAGWAAAVPTCPEWTVRELVRHLGGVHRWATGFVAGARTEPDGRPQEELVGGWPDDDDLGPWLLDGADAARHHARHGATRSAAAGRSCAPRRRSCTGLAARPTRRRSTASTREVADGATGTPFEPAFAADGIDELLALFITRGRRFRSDPARRLRVTTTDADGDWDVVVGPTGVVTLPGGSGTADATVTGEASDLYQTLWNRPVDGAIDATGDESLLGLFLREVKIRW